MSPRPDGRDVSSAINVLVQKTTQPSSLRDEGRSTLPVESRSDLDASLRDGQMRCSCSTTAKSSNRRTLAANDPQPVSLRGTRLLGTRLLRYSATPLLRYSATPLLRYSTTQIRQRALLVVFEDEGRLDVINLAHRGESADREITEMVGVADDNPNEKVVRSGHV
jgi:hypothetical protein